MNDAKEEISILLLDEENLIRSGIKELVDGLEGCRVVAEASSVNEALEIIEKDSGDLGLVISEVHFTGASGIELIHRTKELDAHHLLPLILTNVQNPSIVSKALLAGAKGYMLKKGQLEDLRDALQVVMSSHTYITPSLVESVSLPTNYYSLRQNFLSDDPLQVLSPREREIFHLLVEGMKNSKIAEKLSISARTVETHKARIVRKLNFSNSSEMIRFAIREGLSIIH